MRSFRIPLVLSPLLLYFTTFVASPAFAAGDDWRPVDPAELAMKTPAVERDADAEALFWDVRVDDADSDLVFTHYVRIKVFTERGRESQSKIDIPYFSRYKIKDIAGRTIKPDGQIVELKKDDVFERTIVKVSGLKVKAKSFAMPGIEPGSIIEYRWREVRPGMMANYVRLHFQREIPVHNVTYHIKPLSSPYYPYAMRAQFFHMPNTPFEKEKNGFHRISMTNVAAFREEPRMPPEDQVRSWMLIYYSPDRKLAPDKYWKEYGREMYGEFKSAMKVNDDVRKAAAEIVGDAATPEQKLERLFNFCRDKIKNAYADGSGMSAAEREKMKENKSPADTLKRGVGDGSDIDKLFAALATAAGFDARVALTANRGDIFFDPNFPDSYFLRPTSIAVRVGDNWRFYNPGYNYVTSGMLLWQEEGTQTLVTDPKDPVFVMTPLSEPAKSLEKRVARFKLDEEGTLSGEVRVEYTGHPAVEMKETYDDDTPAEREAAITELVKNRMSTAEVSDVRVENVTDPVKPFAYSYRVRVPGYAQRTGRRLFLQPSFFRRGVGAIFSTSERRHPVYFRFPWAEADDVEIELPAGYALDNPDAPAKFGAGALSQYEPKIQITKDGRTLIYKRQFFFGGGGSLLFPATTYPQLKVYFDELHKQDAHTITLKQAAASASNTPPQK